MYLPTLGRFASRDPLSTDGVELLHDNNEFGSRLDAMCEHPYVYTANNPVNRVDPSGMAWCDLVEGRRKPRGKPCSSLGEGYNTLTDPVGRRHCVKCNSNAKAGDGENCDPCKGELCIASVTGNRVASSYKCSCESVAAMPADVSPPATFRSELDRTAEGKSRQPAPIVGVGAQLRLQESQEETQ